MGLNAAHIPTYIRYSAMSNRLVSTTENVQRSRLDVNPPPGERIYFIYIYYVYTCVRV